MRDVFVLDYNLALSVYINWKLDLYTQWKFPLSQFQASILLNSYLRALNAEMQFLLLCIEFVLLLLTETALVFKTLVCQFKCVTNEKTN